MRSYAVNLAFAVVRVLAITVLIKIATMHLASEALAAFLIIRRYAPVGANFFQLGLSQAIFRFVPDREFSNGCDEIFLVRAFGAVSVFSVGLVLVVYAFGDPIAITLFSGSEVGMTLLFIVMLMSVVGAFDFLVRAYFLAKREVVLANIVDLATGSGILILAVYFGAGLMTVAQIFYLQAAVVLFVSIVLLFRRLGLSTSSCSGISSNSQVEFPTISLAGALHYGLPRGFAAMLEMLLLAVGPWAIGLEDPNAAAGFIVAVVLMRVAQAGITPLSQIMTLTASKAKGMRSGNYDRLEREIEIVGGSVILVVSIFCVVIAPWIPVLMRVWLGDVTIADYASEAFRVLLIGILPFSIYQTLKGVTDVNIRMPLNLFSLVVALGIFFFVLTALRWIDVTTLVAASWGLVSASFVLCLGVLAGCGRQIVEIFPKLSLAWVFISASIAYLASLCFFEAYTRGMFELFVAAGLLSLLSAITLTRTSIVKSVFFSLGFRGEGE